MRQAIYVTVSDHHGQVLDELKAMTDKNKRALMMEGIELLAIHYRLLKRPEDIFLAREAARPETVEGGAL